jgi:UDP-N-acetylglucosamine--N-acetylmuramyl-(pentapeptide) pyrophosphoryl-undecaprenol N-acetylglucosamine transferase
LAIESDAHLGVTNRLLRPFVKRLCLSFPIAGLEPPKYIRTGRPLSAQQLDADAARGRALFGLRADLPTVLVFGGSQGAQSINTACVGAFGHAGSLDFQLVHVCGERNFDEVEAALVAALEGGSSGARRDPEPPPAGGVRFERYHLLPYTDQLAHAMAVADLIVGRSGGSVAEIAALGRPAVLVPYPYASADHQRKNARYMADGGAAVMIDDAGLTDTRLRHVVGELLADGERLARMAAASRALGRPDATQRVADEVERLIEEKRSR